MSELEIQNMQLEIIELKSDIKTILHVNIEMMKLVGFSVSDVIEEKITLRSLVKGLKNTIIELTTNEDGIAGMVSHFASDATLMALKYREVIEIIEKERTNG